jgi:hypothetical protein
LFLISLMKTIKSLWWIKKLRINNHFQFIIFV